MQIKKIFIFSLSLVVFFTLANGALPAHADTLVYQNGNPGDGYGPHYGHPSYVDFGDFSLGTSAYISSVEVTAGGFNNWTSAQVTASILNGNTIIATSSPTTLYTNYPNGGTVHFDFSPHILLAGVGIYHIRMNAPSYNGDIAAGSYFAVYSGSPPPPTIDLSFPGNGSSLPDFTNWVVSFNNVIDAGTIRVDYGYLSSSTFQFSDSQNYDSSLSDNPMAVSKSHSLFYPPLAPGITWYARAQLTGATTTYTSPVISFSIDPSASAPPSDVFSNLAGPFSTIGGGETSSTLVTATGNCQYASSSFFSDPIGNIQQGICQALVFLFVPNTAQQTDLSNSFNSLTSAVGKKPPFGYYRLASDAFNSFTQGTATTTLIATSTYSAFSSVFSPLKIGMGILLIVMFAFWLIHWVAKLQL